jgi:hypothetical protein
VIAYIPTSTTTSEQLTPTWRGVLFWSAERVHLDGFTVSGSPSPSYVADIPLSSPTTLAGHNGGGRSATLAALQFLTGGYTLTEDDRTYVSAEQTSTGKQQKPARCASPSVEGRFTTDSREQDDQGWPEELRLRRIAEEDTPIRLEMWGPVPDDERLRGPHRS